MLRGSRSSYKSVVRLFRQLVPFLPDVASGDPLFMVGRSAARKRLVRHGEMVGVSSDRETILAMLPEATRAIYAPMHDGLRPGWLKRRFCQVAGRALVPQAIGAPRETVPWTG